jgi:hypothetical protein
VCGGAAAAAGRGLTAGAALGGEEGDEAVDEVRVVLEQGAHPLHHVLPRARSYVSTVEDGLAWHGRALSRELRSMVEAFRFVAQISLALLPGMMRASMCSNIDARSSCRSMQLLETATLTDVYVKIQLVKEKLVV